MFVFVAGKAFLRDSEKCFRFPFIGKDCNISGNNFRFFMTLFTSNRCMFSLKRISRLRMVEFLSVKMNYFKIFTVMFFVAFNALLPVDRCMIPFLCRNPRFDFFVTTQALAVRQRFPDRMTLRAVFNSFEIAVSTGQIAGRYLCRSEHRRTRQQQKNSGTPVHFPVISC